MQHQPAPRMRSPSIHQTGLRRRWQQLCQPHCVVPRVMLHMRQCEIHCEALACCFACACHFSVLLTFHPAGGPQMHAATYRNSGALCSSWTRKFVLMVAGSSSGGYCERASLQRRVGSNGGAHAAAGSPRGPATAHMAGRSKLSGLSSLAILSSRVIASLPPTASECLGEPCTARCQQRSVAAKSRQRRRCCCPPR